MKTEEKVSKLRNLLMLQEILKEIKSVYQMVPFTYYVWYCVLLLPLLQVVRVSVNTFSHSRVGLLYTSSIATVYHHIFFGAGNHF